MGRISSVPHPLEWKVFKANRVKTERESQTGSKYELYMARALAPAPAETQRGIYWGAEVHMSGEVCS